MTEEKVTRRGYLKYVGGAVAAAAVAGVGYGIYQSTQPTAPPATTAVTTAPPLTTAPPVTTAPPTGPKDKMYFNVWAWHPEVIDENIKLFNQQNDENGQLVVVGADYATVVETKLMTKGPLDMFYADVPMASRWWMAGWLNAVDDQERFNEIQNDYSPDTRSFTLFPADNKHFGYTYFTGAEEYYYNAALARKWLGKEPDNWEDLPKNNDEMLEACRDVKKKGICENPYLFMGYSWSGGLPYTIEEDMKNLGEELLVDKTFDPNFDVNTKIKELFTYYRALYKEELMNTGAFAMMEAQHISAFTTGKYIFSQQRDYDIGTFNDPEKSINAGDFHYFKKWPSSNGQYNKHLAYPCFYVTSNHDLFKRPQAKRDRIDKFQQWFGGKDNDGKYTAAWLWARDYLLGEPQPGVVDNPEIVASWKRFMSDTDFALRKDDNTVNAYMPIGYIGCIWYSEFKLKMMDIVPKAFTGDRPVDDAITDLRNAVKELQTKYV